ncbi:hypothetical protein Taro_027296 [Colocasia esculenta]|uniref:Uncharacterized protein n=1 Tax=Colocasia esculenta TaxID=4460 RepID=A0A843VHN2_COLES|nr:hypothetical protein [Colocasia esculenta]
MKDSSSSPWFATSLLNAGSIITSKARQEKETPTSRAGPCRAASEHSQPSSHSSSSSSFAASFSCHRGSPVTAPSPLRSSLVVIPFSWEKQPGVPKHCHHHRSNSKEQHRASSCPKLPLPPTLRSNPYPFISTPRRKKKRHVSRPEEDPFALAMLECSREDEDPTGGFCWKGSAKVKAAAGRRERFGFVDLYGCCKTTCSVAKSTVRVPRSSGAAAAYGLLARRAG